MLLFPKFKIKNMIDKTDKTKTMISVQHGSKEYQVGAPVGVWYHTAIMMKNGQFSEFNT